MNDNVEKYEGITLPDWTIELEPDPRPLPYHHLVRPAPDNAPVITFRSQGGGLWRTTAQDADTIDGWGIFARTPKLARTTLWSTALVCRVMEQAPRFGYKVRILPP